MAMNVDFVLVVFVGVHVVIKFSMYENFYILQPIIIKLRLENGANVPDFCTVSNF